LASELERERGRISSAVRSTLSGASSFCGFGDKNKTSMVGGFGELAELDDKKVKITKTKVNAGGPLAQKTWEIPSGPGTELRREVRMEVNLSRSRIQGLGSGW
jgi:hypothetical protein